MVRSVKCGVTTLGLELGEWVCNSNNGGGESLKLKRSSIWMSCFSSWEWVRVWTAAALFFSDLKSIHTLESDYTKWLYVLICMTVHTANSKLFYCVFALYTFCRNNGVMVKMQCEVYTVVFLLFFFFKLVAHTIGSHVHTRHAHSITFQETQQHTSGCK